MRAGRLIVQAVVIASLAFTIGCGSDDAETVAGKFWSAVGDQDLEKAKTYATEETAASLTINDNVEDKTLDVKFGAVSVENGSTVINTYMQTTSGDSETSVELRTVLVREEGQWKVDVNQTMMSMFGGAMDEMMQQMGEAMQGAMEGLAESMEESMQDLGKTLESSMSETPSGN